MKELRCSRCGSSDLHYVDGLVTCNSCNAVFIADEEEKNELSKIGPFLDGVNPKARKLLDRIYHEVLDQKKALKVVNKALEEAPESAEAHLVKMRVLAFHFNDPKQDEWNARNMVSEGMAALEYAKRLGQDKYKEYRYDVYEQMLSTAVSLMSLAAEAMEDESTFDQDKRDYKLLEQFVDKTKQQYLDESDREWLRLYSGNYPAANILVHAVPDDVVEESLELRNKLKEYVIWLKRELKARRSRLGRYGQILSHEEAGDRVNEIDYHSSRLAS